MKSSELKHFQTGVKDAYDRVASEYARNFNDELDRKPFDREMLDQLAEQVQTGGSVCDLGCGPGQVARYLADRGVAVCGIDLSAGMVEQARTFNPEIEFVQGDMLCLDAVDDDTFSGIAAFYAIVNLPPDSVPLAFREMHRALRPNGVALIAFHLGTEVHHRDEWWNHSVNIDFYFFEAAAIKALLIDAGFTLTEAFERDPYPDGEYPSRRAYIFARKPA